MTRNLLDFTKDNQLAILVLNNPPNNLLNDHLLTSLESNIKIAEENGYRAILLRSKLKHFSAGADPKFLSKPSKNNDPMRLIEIVESSTLPTIAAINGAALGGGFELALGCDFIIASETARIGLVEASIGLMPLAGGTQRLVERIGLSRAKEMCMFGRRYDAKTLENWGAINLVVPETQLLDISISFARQLSNGPTLALKEIKALANYAAKYGVKKADEKSKPSIKKVLNSSDAKEGILFLAGNKQSIIFKGK